MRAETKMYISGMTTISILLFFYIKDISIILGTLPIWGPIIGWVIMVIGFGMGLMIHLVKKTRKEISPDGRECNDIISDEGGHENE